MTLSELRERKNDVELEILEILRRFSDDTG